MGIHSALLWIEENWSDLAAFALLLAALGLGIFPGKIAELEKNSLWRLIVPILVEIVGISGFVEGLHEKGVFQGQIKSLSAGVLAEATKDDVASLTTHIDDGFARVVVAIEDLSALCKNIAPKPPQQGQVNPIPLIQPPPPPIIQNSHYAVRRVPSNMPDNPYALQVVLQTDVSVENGGIEIDFDGEISPESTFFIAGQAVMMQVRTGITADHKGFLFSFGFPNWTPDHPLLSKLARSEA